MNSLNNIDFKKLASQQKSIQMKMRLLALAHFKEGYSRTQIAKFLKVSRTSVNIWVHTFLEEGLKGLQEKPRTGRPAFLPPEQKEQLRQYLKDKAHNPQSGRLTGADIHGWLDKAAAKLLPNSPMGKAVSYALKQWQYLERYVEDGGYPIDNNRVEREIRPVATGRKAWLFADTQSRANASAVWFSLMLTCRANGVEPYAYLRHVLTELPQREEGCDVSDLLPYSKVPIHTILSKNMI